MRYLNLVGPQVKRLRKIRGWSQEILSAKLRLVGWKISKGSLAKLEARVLHARDYHLLILAKIFEVPLSELLPQVDMQDPEFLQMLIK